MAACLRCRTEFVKASGVQKYCTRECLKSAVAESKRGPLRDVTCKKCGTGFQTTNAQVLFCGKQCRYDYFNDSRLTSKTEIRSCVVCSASFQPMQKTGPGRRWCSEACKHMLNGSPQRLLKLLNGDADPDKVARASLAQRKHNLKKTFGLSVEQYDEMLASQSGVCAICKKPESAKNGWNGKTRYLAVDHCHSTGRIRGLLCSRCNTSIGQMFEDFNIFQSAVEYLKHHSENANEKS